MSFSFTAIGDREQIAAQVKAIKESGGNDSLLNALADLITEHVGASELHGHHGTVSGWRQVYVIEAGGHSGPQSVLSLHLDIKAPYLPVVDETADELAVELTTELITEDGRQAEVLAVIDKCISDLGFAAPETHADRLAQMRGQVEATFDTVVDADIVDADDED